MSSADGCSSQGEQKAPNLVGDDGLATGTSARGAVSRSLLCDGTSTATQSVPSRATSAIAEAVVGPMTDGARGAAACRIGRGAVRLLAGLGYRMLTEFPLPDGRRADIAALDARGAFAIVEIKSSVADFRADAKWRHYGAFCDAFYFAVDPRFPCALLPEEVGIIVADAWSGAVLRPAVPASLNPARRRALLLRFARTASARLSLLGDPGLAWAGPEW